MKSHKICFFLCSLIFILCSCVSSPNQKKSEFGSGEELAEETGKEQKKELSLRHISSISELKGLWHFEGAADFSAMSYLEYPFIVRKNDGTHTAFFAFSSSVSDDTALWAKFASSKGLSLSQLWQRRFSCLCELYGYSSVPSCDVNGTERGIKVFFREDKICSQSYILVPEKVMMENIGRFLVSDEDSRVFLENGSIFRFYSEFDSEPSEKKLSRAVGLVLSGGGGKGAYEVGVWKALYEFGVSGRVTAFSGTSVGGLNSALFSASSLSAIEFVWRSVVPSELTRDNQLISQSGIKKILDSTRLSSIQEMTFPKVFVTAVRNSNLPFKFIGNTIFQSPGKYATRFLLNDERDLDELKRKLLATSAFPVLTQPVLLGDGYKYIDGGAEEFGGDNTPIDPIIDNCPDIDEIIVVYLSKDPERRVRKIDYEKKFILEIIPSIDLGGIFEGTTNFDAARINLLIGQGYMDTVRILRDDLSLRAVSQFWSE
ncbi:MAG: patatin-like phospholipase family protein [Treponema sp.]|nr:patatin-like phospholipase family protein [Treponema sp.]